MKLPLDLLKKVLTNPFKKTQRAKSCEKTGKNLTSVSYTYEKNLQSVGRPAALC